MQPASTAAITRGPQAPKNPYAASTRPLEAIAEAIVMLTALLSILALFLIIVFVAKEAVFAGRDALSLSSLFSVNPDRVAWQPTSEPARMSVWPLVVGSLKVTLVAMAITVPLSLGAAVYVAEFASARTREVVKPAIELLAGLPSVVIGFFALIVLASIVQWTFGTEHRLNALVAGFGLAFCVSPIVFSLTEDALRAVPRSYVDASLALGASRVTTILRVILPAAAPGVLAATMLGFGRAVGETMIVVLASGNASLLDARLDHSTRTITATIAQELGEVVVGSAHYRVLFVLGAILFAVTLAINLIAERVSARSRRQLTGGS